MRSRFIDVYNMEGKISCDASEDPQEVIKKTLNFVLNQPEAVAEWVYNPDANDWGLGGWCCSNCGFKNDILGMEKDLKAPWSCFAGVQYCGRCGYRMKGIKINDKD